MKITVLVENTAYNEYFQKEHGLSLYIETGDHKILFDMGQTDAFARNALTLGIDLTQVDLAVLSHGHYDHGGGLEHFLRLNTKAPVFVHEAAFGNYYNGTEKYIGLPSSLRHSSRLVRGSGIRELCPGIRLFDCNEQNWSFESYGLNCLNGDRFVPDDFLHEQYLEIREGNKRYVFTGCSHKGIRNIAMYFKPDCLIGGFHLNKEHDSQILCDIAQILRRTNVQCITGHCTGSTQYETLLHDMKNSLSKLTSGIEIWI